MKYKKVKYEEIKNFRKLYLEKLNERQELFIEWIVEKSNYYSINRNDEAIGYFILSKQNSLVELYVDIKDTACCFFQF